MKTQLIFPRIALFVLTFTFGYAVNIPLPNDSRETEKNETQVNVSDNHECAEEEIEETSEPIKPVLKSLSPHDIKSFIGNNPETEIGIIWKGLEIPIKLFGKVFDPEKNKDFFQKCHNCKADIYNYNLDDESGTEILLRVADSLRGAWKYLIFKRIEGRKWKVIGSIDFDFGKYEEPQHSFLLSNGRSFLVIGYQSQSGSGVALYREAVYMTQNGKVSEVIDYLSDGHLSMTTFEPTMEFLGRVTSIEINQGIATVAVKYSVNYSGYYGDLFRKTREAVWFRTLKTHRQQLDSARSNVSTTEIEKIYEGEWFEDSIFLAYNLSELKQIAQKKWTKKRLWLKEYLSRLPNSKEKRKLIKIMSN